MMPRLKYRYPIGIDLGESYCSATQLKPNGQGLAVMGQWHRKLLENKTGSAEEGDMLTPLLKEVGKSRQFRGKRVVLSLPARHVYSFPVRFQINTDDNLEKVIIEESGKRLSFPIEEAIIDYPSISLISTAGDMNDYKATVTAVNKNVVQDYLEILKRAGLTAEVIDFDISAILRLHRYLHGPFQHPYMICHTGYIQSMITIVSGDRIIGQRHFPWGIQILIDKILSNMESLRAADEAEFLIKTYGLAYESREKTGSGPDANTDLDRTSMQRSVYQIIAPYSEELIYEIHKIISFSRSDGETPVFEKIFLYGMGNMIHHFDRFIEKRFDVPAEMIDPLGKLAVKNSEYLSDANRTQPFALALGLAMHEVSWL